MLHFRGKRERERGQIVVLFALVLVVILAFTSLVIDVGLLRNNRQTLVNSLDSAAWPAARCCRSTARSRASTPRSTA